MQVRTSKIEVQTQQQPRNLHIIMIRCEDFMCEFDLVLPMTRKCEEEWHQSRNGTCTFTPDCKESLRCQRIADAYCKCNHGQCVTVGLHASHWIDPNITRDCDEGGYMDCACKYALLLHIFVHMKVLSIFFILCKSCHQFHRT